MRGYHYYMEERSEKELHRLIAPAGIYLYSSALVPTAGIGCLRTETAYSWSSRASWLSSDSSLL